MKTYYISPSDITFLLRDCPRCFYRKVAQGIPRPAGTFPQIFKKIDQSMKSCYNDKNLRDISNDFPDAVFKYPDQWVQSQPLRIPNTDIEIVFRGQIDGVLEYNKTGPNGEKLYAIVDLKTSDASDETLEMYWLALHTYAYCLENSGGRDFSLNNVDKLGLIVFNPESFEHLNGEEPSLKGEHIWVEFEKDQKVFMEWVDQIMQILGSDTPPKASPDCQYCKYFESGVTEKELCFKK
jgi:hypothetical protein